MRKRDKLLTPRMLVRTITSLVSGFFAVFLIVQSLPWVLLLFVGWHAIAQYEYVGPLKHVRPALRWIHIIMSSVVFLLVGLALADAITWQAIPFTLAFAMPVYVVLMVRYYEKTGSAGDYPRLLQSLLLITIPMAFIPALCVWESPVPLILLVLGSSWMADAGAMFTGKMIGKTKLAPRLSPRKTVEGAIAGLFTAGVSWVGAGLVFAKDGAVPFASTLGLGNGQALAVLFVVGVCLAVAGIYGDLALSLIKREAGIKDFGSFLPGHGGVLDRIDSVLFVAPLIYVLGWIVL